MPKILQHLLDHDFTSVLGQFSPTGPNVAVPPFVETTINGIKYTVIRSSDLPWGKKSLKGKPKTYSYFVIDPNPIGKGAYGEIFKAYLIDSKTNKINASKIWVDKKIKFFDNTDEEYKEKSEKEKSKFRERKLKKVRREASFLNQFYKTKVPVIVGSYAHIITEYLGEDDAIQYIEKANPKEPEAPISTLLPRVASANFKEKINLIKEICFAYNNLHHNTVQTGRALFHGDVKGNNIRIQYNEKKHVFDVYIVDFGLARHLGDNPETVFRTLKYLQDEFNIQNEGQLPKGTPYHLGFEAFEGYQGIFNDIYIFTVIFLIILDAKYPFKKKVAASQGFNQYSGQKMAARAAYDFTGLNVPKFPLNIDVAKFLIDFCNRMQNQNYLLRPSTDEVLTFIVALSNLCEVCEKYEAEKIIEAQQTLEKQIYTYSAKLALLSSGLWDVKIGDRQIPEFKLKKMGRRKSTQDSKEIELRKIKDTESVRGILATTATKTFEQLDFDQHPTFCEEIIQLYNTNQLTADSVQLDTVRLNFIKKYVTFENPIVEYDNNYYIILRFNSEEKPEYYLVDRTKRISPYSNELFAAQAIDFQTGAIIREQKTQPQKAVRVVKSVPVSTSSVPAGKQDMEIEPEKPTLNFSYIEFKPGIFEGQTVSLDTVTSTKNDAEFYEMISFLHTNNKLTKELAIVFGIFFAECKLTPDKIETLKKYANNTAILSLLTTLKQNNCFTKVVAEAILVDHNQALVFFKAVNILNHLKILTPKIMTMLVKNKQLCSTVSQLPQMSGEIVYLFILEKSAKEKIALINSLTHQQKRQLIAEIRFNPELKERFRVTNNKCEDIIKLLDFSIDSTYISKNKLTIRQAHIFSTLKQKYLSQESFVNFKYSIQSTQSVNLFDFILLADDADFCSKFLATFNTKQKLELLETVFENKELLCFYYPTGFENLKTVLADSIEFDLNNTVGKYKDKQKELIENDIPGMRCRFFGQILHAPNYEEEYDAAKLLINTIRSFIAGDVEAIANFYADDDGSGITLKHRCRHALQHGGLEKPAKEFMAFLNARKPMHQQVLPISGFELLNSP